jgi:hypothetical protein
MNEFVVAMYVEGDGISMFEVEADSELGIYETVLEYNDLAVDFKDYVFHNDLDVTAETVLEYLEDCCDIQVAYYPL